MGKEEAYRQDPLRTPKIVPTRVPKGVFHSHLAPNLEREGWRKLMIGHPGNSAHESILFVCTANICRSPMAEALFRARVHESVPEVVISSAGFLSDGSLADRKAVWALQQLGLDPRPHRATSVKSALSIDPDLILVMARAHLRSLSRLQPQVIERAFTLKEFVRLTEIEGRRGLDEPLPAYIERVAAGRSVSAVTSPSTDEDVLDPVGRRRVAFARCASELNDLVTALARSLYTADTGARHEPRNDSDEHPGIGNYT